jgi:bleomycin hydrolase
LISTPIFTVSYASALKKTPVRIFLLILLSTPAFKAKCQDKQNTAKPVSAPKIIKLIKTTPLKNQESTNLCWSFATTSFIETEAIRVGKKPVILSPIFFAVPTYVDKAEKYIRMHGISFFGAGDLTFSATKAYKMFGAVPESVYGGKMHNGVKCDYAAIDDALQKKVKYYVDSGFAIKMTSEQYRQNIKNILIDKLGAAPANFTYMGKAYTPKTFAKEMVGINPDDYIEITSFSHHPFYSKFILEMNTNWDDNYYLNLPIKDFISVIDTALNNGYSLTWDGANNDDGNYGFNNNEYLNNNGAGVTQQIRQHLFDYYRNSDDHNMHIIGIAKDGLGNIYYVLKNSLNPSEYTYMPKEYLLENTISVMVNKDAIPSKIRKKCKIQER